MRKVSETLLKNLRDFEGLSLEAYQDVAGVWTIGYGHTIGVRRGDKIGISGAESYLKDDLAPIERFLNTVPQIRTQGQFDALADFAFNLGIERLKSSTLFKMIKAGARKADIQRQFMRWVYAGKKVQGGLVKRRKWEAKRYGEDN